MYEYKGNIERVVDGDTVIATVDLGFNSYIKERFRLARINAPEIRGEGKEEGLVSKVFLEDILEKYDNKVIINSLGRDKYGRYLAELLINESDDLVCINDLMIANNMAVKYNKG